MSDRYPHPQQRERFTSLTDLIEHVQGLPAGATDERRGYEWCGAAPGELRETTGARLALRGWPEGARRASALASKIADRTINAPSAMHLRTDITYDVQGMAYDVGAYLSGEPECWLAHEETASKRAVRLVVDLGVSCGVPHHAIETRGIAMCGLVLALQAQGYPVTVDVCVIHGKHFASVRIIDAETGSILDIDRLTYAIAHLTMARGWLPYAINGQRGSTSGTRWGNSCPYNGTATPAYVLAQGPCDLYIGAAHLNAVERWQDGGEAWVLSEYEKQTSA